MLYAYSRRGFSKSKLGAKRGRKVSKRPRGGRKSIAKIVKSIISRQAENKVWFDYGANQSMVTASLGTVPAFTNLLPTLSQGTGHSARVGNEVRVKSAVIKGHINILPYDVTLNPTPVPLYVKMWLCSSKVVNTNALAGTSITSNFFDVVNSSVGMQGNMLDIELTNNKDVWTVHATKTIKIGAGAYVSTGPIGQSGYFDNSPMSAPFSFAYGKYLKTLKYDDTASVCNNRNMFLVFQPINANGANCGGYIMAERHYTCRVEYEDL